MRMGEPSAKVAADPMSWPSFDEIPEPRMVCFGVGNGSGSKLFQGYLDSHPQIYMVPAYMLMYLYPHWQQWQRDLKHDWTWKAIIDVFCIQHASLIDSRLIPGHDGLAALGKTQDQHLAIDEDLFRAFLAHLLGDRPINSRAFVLAVHYAHAFARGEDLSRKRVLVYHLHVHEYVRYLAPDFPEMLTLGFVRDQRSNLKGRFQNNVTVDQVKLNGTDAAVYFRRTFLNYWRYHIDSLERLRDLDPDRVRVVRHEDMHYHLEELMRATAKFLGIDFHPHMLEITFGGLEWWGDKMYKMKPMNEPNPRVISLDWQKELSGKDWFVLEGLGFDYCRKYGYTLYKYKEDTAFNRIGLFLAMFLPFGHEGWIFRRYLSPGYFIGFVKAALDEASGRAPLKDYGFNAFYRHKWCNLGLNLHVEPWYRRFLLFARGRAGGSSARRPLPLLSPLAKGIYVTVQLGRYLFSVMVFPLLVLKRGFLSVAVFSRMVRKTEVLPRPLI